MPAAGFYVLVGILALGGVAMALGFCYRVSIVAVFLTWGYLFAVESTRTYWQSYYYLELLMLFLLMWMPAARTLSIDSCLAPGQDRSRTVPLWTIFLLRGQLFIAYFYAGVSKLNKDWLLDAAPLRWHLKEPHVLAPYVPYLSVPQTQLIQG